MKKQFYPKDDNKKTSNKKKRKNKKKKIEPKNDINSDRNIKPLNPKEKIKDNNNNIETYIELSEDDIKRIMNIYNNYDIYFITNNNNINDNNIISEEDIILEEDKENNNKNNIKNDNQFNKIENKTVLYNNTNDRGLDNNSKLSESEKKNINSSYRSIK